MAVQYPQNTEYNIDDQYRAALARLSQQVAKMNMPASSSTPNNFLA